MTNVSMPATTDSFTRELQAVGSLLQDVAQNLKTPLNELVLSQIRRAFPHRRAAVVLTFAITDADDVHQTEQRIHLAAALEALAIAQSIHHLLLGPEAEGMEKSLMGSIILAGDYCFSCSADFAVQTDNPTVVRIFSTALKRLSEANLRVLFDDSAPPTADEQLFASGIEAALLLANSPSVAHANPNIVARAWAHLLTTSTPMPPSDPPSQLNHHQHQRLLRLVGYL